MHDVTIHRVTPEVLQRIHDTVINDYQGTVVSRDTIETQGVRCSYLYDEATATLGLTFHSLPILVSKGYVIGLVYDALRAATIK